MNLAPAGMFPDATIAHDLNLIDGELARLTARRDGVGSSDVAAVMGNSNYHTPLSLWEDKTGRTPIDTVSSEAAEWGHRLEPVVATAFAERFGGELFDAPYILQSNDCPWHLASPDFVIVPQQRPELVEVKCRRFPWDDGPPQDIVDQVVWQMHVTGIEKAHIVVLVSGQEMPPPYSMMADPERASVLTAAVDEFWAHVQFDEPPPPKAVDTYRMIPGPGELLLPAELLENLIAANELKAQIKELSDRRNELHAPVQVAMADYEKAVTPDGKTAATFKKGAKSRTFLPKEIDA